jgi:hypothetical protein
LEEDPETRGDDDGNGDEEDRRDDDAGERERLKSVGEGAVTSSSDDEESRTFSNDLYPFVFEDIFLARRVKYSKISVKQILGFPHKAANHLQSQNGHELAICNAGIIREAILTNLLHGLTKRISQC